MSILGKLRPGAGSKYSAKLRQTAKLLDKDKVAEAAEQIKVLWEEKPGDIDAADLQLLKDMRLQVFNRLIEAGRNEEALKAGEQLAADEPAFAGEIADRIISQKMLDNRVIKLVRDAVSSGDEKQKSLMLRLAKNILAARGDNLSSVELEFMSEAARAYPLWKDGLGLLADLYLRENRRDADAVVVYRNAYPNRKADRRLREVLLESLILNREKDDFAASVYKDTVETSDNPKALELLAEYYIQTNTIGVSVMPYIQLALQKCQIDLASLVTLTGYVLNSDAAFVDRVETLLLIYRQGFYNKELLSFLSEKLADQNRFDNEAIQLMSLAFEQRVVSKRAILILTEHCLANERNDTFAVRVYESYLSNWPDRPQRHIYNILSHHYAGLTRVDEQAQKIYEEALEDTPTDPVVINILARAYHAMDRRDDLAERIYKQAFGVADEAVKLALATILAEMRVAAGAFNAETLTYLNVMGRPERGPLAERYDEVLTNCFLAAGRRGEQAQEAYFTLFRKTEESPDINPRLVELLADIIKERGVPPQAQSEEMRVYKKLFALQKFSADPEISFVLLDYVLKTNDPAVNVVNLAVRCFEADADRIIAALTHNSREQLLQEIGDFYIEHYNFSLAAKAYQASYEISPTEQISYRLAKIQLLDGNGDAALRHLSDVRSAHFTMRRHYWEAAAHQLLHDPTTSDKLLGELRPSSEIPEYLLAVRRAINTELRGDLEGALKAYGALTGTPGFEQFDRWIGLQRGIVLLILGRLEAARDHLEEVHRLNPNGRAEQLFYSLALFAMARERLKNGDLNGALPIFTHAVEINRSHRLLRKVIVELLLLHGQRAFFEGNLHRTAQILEVAHRILPKRPDTKTYLAYTYHRLNDYAKALIYYRDISWDTENPRLQRSHAYAFLSNGRPQKAWRVFQDLVKRGNMLAEDYGRLIGAFLTDKEAENQRAWEKIEFPDSAAGAPLSALLIHDGLNERAVAQLNKMIAEEPENPQLRWYLGKAYSRMNERDLAVHNWKQLLELCGRSGGSPNLKIRQFTEIGLAFLDAGYAKEAMQTWEELRKFDENNPDLPKLYAATLDLNAYQLARKDQNKLAREEWKKALQYAPEDTSILQNSAVVNLLLDDNEEATRQFHKLSQLWQRKVMQNPRESALLRQRVTGLERAMNTLALTKGRSEFDLTKIRAEDAIDYYQRANQFYWILGLDKRASRQSVEHEYFRLIKIFNPERHADDFMLVEESYSSLFKSEERRALIDLFVFNPVDMVELRSQLSQVGREGDVSFEKLALPTTIPPPDYQQLKVENISEAEMVKPLEELLKINFKIPDWKIV